MTDTFRIMGYRRAGSAPAFGELKNANEDGEVEQIDTLNSEDGEAQALEWAARYRRELPTWKVWAERMIMFAAESSYGEDLQTWNTLWTHI